MILFNALYFTNITRNKSEVTRMFLRNIVKTVCLSVNQVIPVLRNKSAQTCKNHKIFQNVVYLSSTLYPGTINWCNALVHSTRNVMYLSHLSVLVVMLTTLFSFIKITIHYQMLLIVRKTKRILLLQNMSSHLEFFLVFMSTSQYQKLYVFILIKGLENNNFLSV